MLFFGILQTIPGLCWFLASPIRNERCRCRGSATCLRSVTKTNAHLAIVLGFNCRFVFPYVNASSESSKLLRSAGCQSGSPSSARAASAVIFSFEPGRAAVQLYSSWSTSFGSKSHCPCLIASNTDSGTTNSFLDQSLRIMALLPLKPSMNKLFCADRLLSN